MALLGLVAATVAALLLPEDGFPFVPQLLVAFVFVAAAGELAEVRIRHGNQAEAITFFDAILCAAVLLMPPSAVIVAAGAAAVLSQLLLRRAPLKAVFNVGSHLVSTTLLVSSYHFLAGEESSAVLRGELSTAVLAALLAGALLFCVSNLVLLYRVFWILDGSPVFESVRRALPLGVMAAFGNASLGAVAALILRTAPALLPVLIVVAAVLMFTYRSAARVENHEDRAAQLSTFAALLTGTAGEDRLPAFLRLLRGAFHADSVVFVSEDGTFALEESGSGTLERRDPLPEEERFLRLPESVCSGVISSDLPVFWRSMLLAPVRRDGRRHGMVAVGSGSRSRPFDTHDASLLLSLAGSLQVAEENDDLFERIRTITSSQSEGIVMLDGDSRITFVNPAAQALLGDSPDEGCLLTGGPADELLCLEYAGKRLDLLSDASGRLVGEEGLLLCVPTEREIFVDFSLSPLADGDGALLVFRDVSELRSARRELEASQRELTLLGRTLQESLLPPVLPSSSFFTVAARYHPGAEGLAVGGDFYDLVEHSDSEWTLVVGDVCGRGAEAAALTALTGHTIRAAALREPSPAGMLEILNEAVLRHRGDDRFCTVAACRLRFDGAPSITVSRAGHPPVLIVRSDGSVVEAGDDALLVGVLPSLDATDRVYELRRGDLVVMYTDGVTETRAPSGEFFQDHLPGALSQVAGRGAEVVAAHLEERLCEFRGGVPADDDTAFVVLAIR